MENIYLAIFAGDSFFYHCDKSSPINILIKLKKIYLPFRLPDYRIGFWFSLVMNNSRRVRCSTTRSWIDLRFFQTIYFESLENLRRHFCIGSKCQLWFLLMEILADRSSLLTAEPISFIRDSCTHSSARLLLSDFRTLRSLVIDSDV